MSDTRKPLLTVKQAAEVYQVTERTMWTWVAKGAVPSIRIGGVRRVVPETHTGTSTSTA